MATDDAVKHVQQNSEKGIIESKQRLDDMVEQYVSMRQFASGSELEATRVALHRTVLDFHWRLRPHAQEQEIWENATDDEDEENPEPIYEGRHPVTGDEVVIQGLSDLDAWIDKTELIDQPIGGPANARSSREVEVALKLPADAALAAAEELIQVFHTCGWSAEAKERTPQTEITDEMIEEVEEWRQANLE